MRITPWLPFLPGHWPGVVASDRVLSIGQTELNYVITLNWIVWNQLFLHLIECKQKPEHMLNWIVWNKNK